MSNILPAAAPESRAVAVRIGSRTQEQQIGVYFHHTSTCHFSCCRATLHTPALQTSVRYSCLKCLKDLPVQSLHALCGMMPHKQHNRQHPRLPACMPPPTPRHACSGYMPCCHKTSTVLMPIQHVLLSRHHGCSDQQICLLPAPSTTTYGAQLMVYMPWTTHPEAAGSGVVVHNVLIVQPGGTQFNFSPPPLPHTNTITAPPPRLLLISLSNHCVNHASPCCL
jgi:hypothetical protein